MRLFAKAIQRYLVTGAMSPPGRPRIIHSPVWMVLLGLIVRVLYIAITHCYRFETAHWFGYEMANLGYSLATGQGFSAPFRGDTGPSAWTGPVYPWLVSLAFRAFGVRSHAAAFAILVFNSVFAALSSWSIYRIARRVFNQTVAVWSGWLWALSPGSIYFSVGWIWETTLSTFLLSLLVMLTLEMEDDDRLLPWCGYGLLWAGAGLTNSSVLAWLPFAGSWLAWQLHRHGRRLVGPVVLGAVVFWMTLAPWLARNYIVFREPLLLRSGFGVNLRAGNNPEAQGWWVISYTCNNPVLFAQYKEKGEAAFDNEQARLAREWIAEHPQAFLVLSCRRLLFFWAGIPHEGLEQAQNFFLVILSVLSIAGLLLAIKRRMHGIFPFVTLLVSYPFVYYFTFPSFRYRHAIEPELLILAVFCVWSLFALLRLRTPDSRPLGGGM